MKDEITYENIPDSNISQIPYKGNELLSFVNETGDTALFKCTGYNNYYDESYYWNGNPDCQWKSITKTQQIDFTFIDTANVNRSFRVNYSLDRISKKFATVNFHMPKNELLYGQFFSYFYRLDRIDTINTLNGKTIIGSYIDLDKKWFYSREIGFAQFTDQFENKWVILR
ncbi:MAG: hypothetical protein ACOVP1_02845 [Bacteroidia bacterium]